MGKIIKGKYIEFDGRTSSSLNNVKIHFGIQQEGSGQPAVDNVRPLSGYGTIMLNISGKNLLNENLVVHKTWVRAGTDGSYGGRSSNSYDAAFLDVASFQGKTLTISQGPEASLDGGGLPYYGISFLDKTNTIQSYYRNTAGKGKPMTFVIPEGTARIGYTYPIEDRTTAQVELGDKVTSFDTRKAQRYPIIFKANDTDLAHQSNCQILENIAITDAGQLSASTRSLTMVLPCKPNTIYSIEHLINNIRVDYERFAIGCNSTLQTAANTQINILSTLPQSCGYKYLTIKTLPNANYLYVRYRGGGTNVNENTPADCLAGLHIYECKELCNGIVDVNTGTVTVDWEYITFDGSSDEAWNVETGSAGTNFYIQIPDAMIDNSYGDQVLCNVAKNRATGGWAPGCCFISSTKNLNLAIGDLIGVTSVANFKTWLASNNVQLVYKLATPKTYQIEPYTLELLSEKNILWTDSDVQVEATIEDETFTTVNSGNTIDSTDIASFVTSSCFPIESLKVYFTPKQAGSGDPSPTNTRAISGYTNIKAEQRGRNLLINIAPPGYNSIVTLNSDGSMTLNGTFGSGYTWFDWNTSVNFAANSTTQYVQTRLLPNGKYYGGPDFYVDENHATNGYPRFSPDLSNYDGTNTRTGTMPTIDSDGCFVIDDTYKYNWYRIYQTAANTFSNYTIYPRCFLASETDRSWEPCTFNTYTINLGDTYYGGYVDLINGTLVVDTGYVPDLGALTWDLNSSEKYRYYCRDLQTTAAPSSLRSTWCLCSNLIPITDGRAYADCPDHCIYFTDTKSINVHFLDIDSDAAAVKTALSGVSFAYKLATPQVIHLTPQKIRTLLGRNNIWSFDGTVEVKYNAIKDSPEIMQKRRFFMTNSPHLQQAESGNTGYCDTIARFETNLTLPLKEATVTLSPIQAGSGDPSPTNVRAISGVDNIQVTKAGVNLLECDTFSNGTVGGLTYTGTWNNDGQLESVQIVGTNTGANAFRNLNYTASKFKLLNGNFVFNGYSPQNAIHVVHTTTGYVDINGASYSSFSSPYWHEYNIYEADTSNWARLQVYPQQANQNINTTVYPMMCLPQDKGCDYEPFKGIKYSISLPTTIYEGTLNLITGELTVNYKLYTFTGEETELKYGWDGILLQVPDSISDNGSYIVKACSHTNNLVRGVDIFNTSRGNAPNTTELPVCAAGSAWSQLRFRNRDLDPDYTKDIELYRTWLRQQYAAGTPLQMVYQLQTPLVYQLTPQVIRTFRGVNNIWADNGIMNIKYWAI